MNSVISAFRKKTSSICPICGSPMYMVYWHTGKRSLMCIKCHFGFNYDNQARN